jgi:anhydro-N-acetylmuramic acid kinase
MTGGTPPVTGVLFSFNQLEHSMKNDLLVAGMMSGTSLDGMDLVLCRFSKEASWKYEVMASVTYAYTPEWKERLTGAPFLGAEAFILLHQEYGRFIGGQVRRFLDEFGLRADLVSSHGHTIFHQPDRRMTFQLGEGAAIAASCGITTVSDFRTFDVALGGQGAPLVPIGDDLLFSEYRFCLNLGGFANVSTRSGNHRLAFDVCPVNIVLNAMALETGREYDAEGSLGRTGKPDLSLVDQLDRLSYYAVKGPKSLGREWVETVFVPLLDRSGLSLEDRMSTVYEHIARQIGNCVAPYGKGDMLVTGGGAFNTYLLEQIAGHTPVKLVVPDENLVKFKEAVVFAFLGLLRYRHESNSLASVTGATRDSASGVVHRMD